MTRIMFYKVRSAGSYCGKSSENSEVLLIVVGRGDHTKVWKFEKDQTENAVKLK